jgi:hypothetical protein
MVTGTVRLSIAAVTAPSGGVREVGQYEQLVARTHAAAPGLQQSEDTMKRSPVDDAAAPGVEWERAPGDSRRLLWLFGDGERDQPADLKGNATAPRLVRWWRQRVEHTGTRS